MKFYGQFEPKVDKFIYDRYFPDIGIEGVFVECGAFDGITECSCKFFEETMQWEAYNFEPIPWIFEQLEENRPNATNLNFGLSNKETNAIFHAVEHPEFGLNCTNGSLEHSPSHKDILDEIGCKIKDIEVQLTTWSHFIRKYDITHIDLFVLDVEGHELSVIKGMIGAEILPDIICVEYGHIGLSKVRVALESLGYYYDITSNANAYFIKIEKLPLFNFRKRIFNEIKVEKTVEVIDNNVELEKENSLLKEHLNELQALYNDIISSKTWKFMGRIKKVLGRS